MIYSATRDKIILPLIKNLIFTKTPGAEKALFQGKKHMNNKPLCVILARGGSKRVVGKNTRSFNGLPMVAWPTKIAVASSLFSRVIISTEDAHIATIARQFGAEYPFARPANLATDYATTAEVLHSVLTTLQLQKQSLPDFCCCLYGTSAFLKQQWLHNAYNLCNTTDSEFIITVAKFSHPIERALQLDEFGNIFYINGNYALLRTQDLPISYYDLGVMYWVSTHAFLSQGEKSFLQLKKKAIIVSQFNAIDIDSEEDWNIAEKLFAVQEYL